MPREPLSVVVTTFNNAATLERCLASVAFADDRAVLDSGSTDATSDIARRFGARVAVEPFRGYSAQKQSAIDRAKHDWVLLLDSDEALPTGRARRSNARSSHRAKPVSDCHAASRCSGRSSIRGRGSIGTCACSIAAADA